MKGIIHSNWDSDIVLEEGDLEKLSKGEILHGEIHSFPKIGELSLSASKEEFKSSSYFKLDWDIKDPYKYFFNLSPTGMQLLKENNYVHGRYEDGLDGSKLAIYGPGKDELVEDNINFSLEMARMRNKEDTN